MRRWVKIWGAWHEVRWAHGISWHEVHEDTSGWMDFNEEESELLEEAWTNACEIVALSDWKICILPLAQGGQKWCRGWKPFRLNTLENTWVYIRRFVVPS
jgi:hypothetical protein